MTQKMTTRLRETLYSRAVSDKGGTPTLTTRRSADAFCTYCSREKDTAARLLPAHLRYTSSRVYRVGERARQAGARFLVLSGRFGLLDATDLVPWYDHLLQLAEVPVLSRLAASQLQAKGVTVVHYFTEPLVRESLVPYFRAIRQATELAGVSLEVVLLAQEEPMSDWRNVMAKAEQAKRLLTVDRRAGDEAFAAMLKEFPGDGMVYLKRGEAYEAVGETSLAASDYERAAGLFPMEKWKAIARDALARAARRPLPQGTTHPPTSSEDSFADLPAELRGHWRDALGGPVQFPAAHVALYRAAVERSVVYLLRVRGIQVPPRAGLSEQIRLLQDHNVVPAAVVSHLHTIRSLGNEAAHGGQIGDDETEACRVGAKAILKAVRAALP